MKKLNAMEMRTVEGGATAKFTAKCSICGKKYTVKQTYSKWNLWAVLTVPSLVKSAAAKKAKNCAYSDALKW